MDQLELFTRISLNAWELNIKRITATFNGLTDEQLYTEVAPGKNRAIYLLGHLTAVNDMMQPLLGIGEREYLQLDEAFVTNPDRAIEPLPTTLELRTYWTNINSILSPKLGSISTGDWFMKHTMISEEDFAKEPHRNRISVLLSRTNHLSYHLGQLVLLKK